MRTKQQRKSYRAHKRSRWQAYSTAKKFASIWLWLLLFFLVGVPIAGFIALLVYFTFWLAMWYVPLVALGFVITCWACEQ